MISEFEATREKLEKENQSLKEANLHLEDKAYQLVRSLERQDEFRKSSDRPRPRQKKNIRTRFRRSKSSFRAQNNDLRIIAKERDLVAQDVRQEMAKTKDLLAQTEARKAEVEEQLTVCGFYGITSAKSWKRCACL